LLPDGDGLEEELVAGRGKDEDAAAAISGILRDLDETAALERFQSGR